MNELISLLQNHVSVRQFSDRDISAENEQLIVSTAERSPTSSNLHAYSIIGIRDSKSKLKLAELTGGQQHVVDCSLFLIFCADMYRLRKLREKQGYNFNGDTTESLLLATVDAALAADRALIAAQGLGIGGVMVGGIRNHPKEVCDLAAIPELVYPVMGMSLGYPLKKGAMKPRLPIDALYFRESYNEEKINRAVAEYDSTIAELKYLKGREVEPGKYPNFEGEYSWSEHSARRMAVDPPGTNRIHMLSFLQERGLLKR